MRGRWAVDGEAIANGILIAAASVVSSLVAVRTRFALIEARIEREKHETATLRQHDKEMLDAQLSEMSARIDRHHKQARSSWSRAARRQKVTLEVIAEIAVKLNVKHRALGVDALVRTIHESREDDAR